VRLFHEHVKPGYFPGQTASEPLVSYECAREGWKNKDNTDSDSETGNARQSDAKPSRPKPTRPVAGTIIRNQIGVELVYVPPGSFMMGSNNGDSDEKPVHDVTIREGFYMGRYEVTQSEWQDVIGNSPSKFKGNNLPVESVSWLDARKSSFTS
jgi:formylglycine-generating enzyme required for sulfatase activity